MEQVENQLQARSIHSGWSGGQTMATAALTILAIYVGLCSYLWMSVL